MTVGTSSTSPAPDFGHAKTPPKRVLWKWSFVAAVVIVVILVFLTWRCGSAFVQGRKLANAAVQHFHERLNAEEYEEIYVDADDGFRAGQTHDELIKFLQAVHKKLGNAGEATQSNIRVDANTNGTFITTSYRTTFDKGAATERFIWVTNSGELKLHGYHIESNALITN